MEMTDDPMAKLPDDILAEIISRVPYKSTCCCKCVSPRWRDLISHPDHCKKMPQSLTGFFYESYKSNRFPMTVRHFTNVSRKTDPWVDPSLSFLPKYESIEVLDCCNGLLLCRYWKPADRKTMDYVVCNPATEKWVVVPATKWSSEVGVVARLGFEPAVSSHFHVFEFVNASVLWEKFDPFVYANQRCEKVGIYSSKTGIWSHKDVIPSICVVVVPMDSSVFLRGTLYLSALYALVIAVDFEGNDWRLIPTPVTPYEDDALDDIYLSQGQLCFAHKGDSELSIWVLEDLTGDDEDWTFKHNVSCLELFGELFPSIGNNNYNTIAIHPEHNVIFIVCGYKKVLIACDMDSRELRLICELGYACTIPYIPYVPLFSKSLADGN